MIATAMPHSVIRILTALAALFVLVPASAALALDLETVQEAIRLSGARWVAGETSVSGLSDAEKKKLVGLLPEPQMAERSIQPLFRAPITAPLPTSLDWRSHNGKNYVSAVKYQGMNCGSCWAFAGVGALESYVMLRTHQPGLDIDLSEQIILSCFTTGGCDGGNGRTVADLLRGRGVPPEACLPYAVDDDHLLCNGRCDDWKMDTHTITNSKMVLPWPIGSPQPTPEEIIDTLKSNLALYGPLWTSMQVYSDFYKYVNGIYEYVPSEKNKHEGGHAILLIGYDDDTEAFIVKNSWATTWGENGYFRIAYSQVANRIDFGAYAYAYGDPIDLDQELPIADAGDDVLMNENEAVILDGTDSYGPDGPVDRYQWHQVAGPEVDLDDPNTASPSFTPPEQAPEDTEALIFRLTVMKDGLIATDTVSAEINEAPTARAGADFSTGEKTVTQLDGSGSIDPEGEALSYHWDRLSGPEVSLDNANAPQPSFTTPNFNTPENREVIFNLTVTDPHGLIDTDQVKVTITWENDPPTANAGEDIAVNEGTVVQLDGRASDDTEGEINRYQWRKISGPDITLRDEDTPIPNFTAPNLVTPGDAELVFELTVTDAANATDTDQVTITITWENEAPLAVAGENQTVETGGSVTLDASASSDPDDGITTYAWTQMEGPEVQLSTPGEARTSFTAPANNGTAPLKLRFQLQVTDHGGLSATDSVTVTVTIPAENAPPTAAAGEDQTVEGSASVTLDASASSDPDDGIATYAWNQVEGPEVQLSTPGEAQTGFTAPVNDGPDPLQLRFELQVTDTGGLSATDSVEIWITPQADPTDPTDPQDPGDNPDDPDAPKDTPEPEVKSSGGGGGGCFISNASWSVHLPNR